MTLSSLDDSANEDVSDQKSREHLLNTRAVEWLTTSFPGLSRADAQRLATELGHVWASAGEQIIAQDDPSAKCMYLVAAGEVTVRRRETWSDREVSIANLGPGDLFGEASVLRDDRRSASVYARTDVDLLSIERETYQRIASSSSMNGREADIGPLDTERSAGQMQWSRAVRAGCHALVSTHGAVRSIDLTGRQSTPAQSVNLVELTGLARIAAREYGVEVRTAMVNERPRIRLALSSQSSLT